MQKKKERKKTLKAQSIKAGNKNFFNYIKSRKPAREAIGPLDKGGEQKGRYRGQEDCREAEGFVASAFVTEKRPGTELTFLGRGSDGPVLTSPVAPKRYYLPVSSCTCPRLDSANIEVVRSNEFQRHAQCAIGKRFGALLQRRAALEVHQGDGSGRGLGHGQNG